MSRGAAAAALALVVGGAAFMLSGFTSANAAKRRAAGGSSGGLAGASSGFGILSGGNMTQQTSSGPLGLQTGELKGVPNFTAFDALFRAQGAEYGVRPIVLKAIALQESSLRPDAANTSNPADPSYGLMQISCMPDGAGGCLPGEFNFPDWPPVGGQASLLEPAVAIHYAAELMAENLRATGGNYAQAVQMYNSGGTHDPAYLARINYWLGLMGQAPL